MIPKLYVENYRFENGVKKPILVPENEIPTFAQFKYWYEKEQNLTKSLIKRKGSKEFSLKHRAVLGKSDNYVVGPGSVYQIDATIADVYLVSRYNRNWIIGRPVIYAVIDCFSRMVVGIYVGLEGPSWIGAMMALTNAFTEKVSYCKEYGINICKEDWPCFHIPGILVGDRGEMESRHTDTLENALNVKIRILPPYRADWKGVVEQFFNTINNGKVKPFVPGHIDKDFRTRGAKDYRLNANLDINEFTQVIIKCVLHHNNEHWLSKKVMDEIMIEEDIDLRPKDLWNWGGPNRSGILRAYPGDMIKLNLMPADQARITQYGIKFNNMFYSCQRAIEEQWFERARNKGTWKESIAYDPRNMDFIYIKSDDAKSFIKCSMIDKRTYGEKTLDEILYYAEYQKLKLDENLNRSRQANADLFADIKHITDKATKKTNEQRDNSLSNLERTRNIKENRAIEKEQERKNKNFELGTITKENTEPAKVLPINRELEGSTQYPNNLDYLQKKQMERMGKKDE